MQVKRPAERKRLKRRGEEGREGGREKASGAKQLQEALFGTGGELAAAGLYSRMSTAV
jgi:hypothetical protein